MPATVYTRSEHGAFPIHVTPQGYKIPKSKWLTQPNLAGRHFTQGRDLLAAIVGPTRMTPKRYFRLDPVGLLQMTPPQPTVFDVLADNTTLGIDLNKRGHEVRKLLYAGFGGRISRSGYDHEEVLQEVYRGILARNAGKCPFDASKSSFGHYVHMVCECILNNYHRKESRRRQVEQVGFLITRKGQASESLDVAEATSYMVNHNPHDTQDEPAAHLLAFLGQLPDSAEVNITPEEREDVRNVLPHMLQSRGRREIMALTGLSYSRVASATELIRDLVRQEI